MSTKYYYEVKNNDDLFYLLDCLEQHIENEINFLSLESDKKFKPLTFYLFNFNDAFGNSFEFQFVDDKNEVAIWIFPSLKKFTYLSSLQFITLQPEIEFILKIKGYEFIDPYYG